MPTIEEIDKLAQRRRGMRFITRSKCLFDKFIKLYRKAVKKEKDKENLSTRKSKKLTKRKYKIWLLHRQFHVFSEIGVNTWCRATGLKLNPAKLLRVYYCEENPVYESIHNSLH